MASGSASSPQAGKSRPVIATNRVFLTSINDIRKDLGHRSRIKKSPHLEESHPGQHLAESDPSVRVELAEDIKVKVQVEPNNNIPAQLVEIEDSIHLQEREEPSGAEGDDCEDLDEDKDTTVENHEDIQVKVFTHFEHSAVPAIVNMQTPSAFGKDGSVPISSIEQVRTDTLSDSDENKQSEVRKKSKKMRRCKYSSTSLSEKDPSYLSHSNQSNTAESPTGKCIENCAGTRDQSKSPSKLSRNPSPLSASNRHEQSGRSRSSFQDRPETTSKKETKRHHRSRSSRFSSSKQSPSRRDGYSRSGSSRSSSRDCRSPSRNHRKHLRPREGSRASPRDKSESPRRDSKRLHRSRDTSRIVQESLCSQKRENDTSSDEEKMANCNHDKEKYESNKQTCTISKGTDNRSFKQEPMSCDVQDIPLPPCARNQSSEDYVSTLKSEYELVNNRNEMSPMGGTSFSNESKDLKQSFLHHHTPQALPSQDSSFHQTVAEYIYSSPPASRSNEPYYMHPQSAAQPSMSGEGYFQWGAASISHPVIQSPSQSHLKPFQVSRHSPSPAQVPTASPAIPEVDKKYQRLQNLHNPPRPAFHGYQLIGDSMLLRFSQKLLGDNIIIAESLRFLGYCVSGQRIGDLLKRLRSGFYHLGKKVVLMIGTNDLLKSTPGLQMCNDLDKVVQHLIVAKTEDIIILTLPPVPRLQSQTYHWQRLNQYNEHIKKLADKERGISIFNITPFYILSQEELEEEELVAEFKTDFPFCNGCFTCIEESADSSWNISSESDEDDFVDTAMLTRVIINTCRSKITPVDVCRLFADHRIPRCRIDYFETTFSDNGRKDLIHLNCKGLTLVKEELYKYI